MEKTFVMIKPQHVEFVDDIFEELDFYAVRTQTAKVDGVPKEIIESHYAVHEDKPFFGYMTQSFVGQKVILAVYEGEGVIKKFMDVIGATDPAKAEPYSIRGKLGWDSLDAALSEKRPCENVIHRSDSIEEANREIEVWKHYLQ